MGCSESKCKSIRVKAREKLEESVREIEKEKPHSSSSSGMGSSASASPPPASPEDWKDPHHVSLPHNHITLDTIPNSDLGESLDVRRPLRLWSAPSNPQQQRPIPTSAKSEESSDSGIYELDDDYSFVITETSQAELVQRVEREFTPVENLDLTVTGKACPRLLSGSQKVRREEESILEQLRHEGFISTSKQSTGGGLAFEIVESTPLTESASGSKLKPKDFIPEEHKQRLAKQRNRFGLPNLTPADINRRQYLAEERRRMGQEAKIEKINAIAGQPLNNTGKMEEFRKKKEEKDNAAIEKRATHLKELRDRIKAQNKRCQQVKLRKQLNAPPKPVPVGLDSLNQQQEEEDDIFRD